MTKHNGQVIIPGWIPERYTFEQGTFYQSHLFERFTVTYSSNAEWLLFEVTIFPDDNTVVGFQYERDIVEPEITFVDGVEVLLYENSDDHSINASWLKDNVEFNLCGFVTREEVQYIVGSVIQ